MLYKLQGIIVKWSYINDYKIAENAKLKVNWFYGYPENVELIVDKGNKLFKRTVIEENNTAFSEDGILQTDFEELKELAQELIDQIDWGED